MQSHTTVSFKPLLDTSLCSMKRSINKNVLQILKRNMRENVLQISRQLQTLAGLLPSYFFCFHFHIGTMTAAPGIVIYAFLYFALKSHSNLLRSLPGPWSHRALGVLRRRMHSDEMLHSGLSYYKLNYSCNYVQPLLC